MYNVSTISLPLYYTRSVQRGSLHVTEPEEKADDQWSANTATLTLCFRWNSVHSLPVKKNFFFCCQRKPDPTGKIIVKDNACI